MTGIRRFASVALFLLAGCASARSTAPCEPTTSGGEQAEPIVVLMDRDPERHEVPIEGRPSKGPHDALVTIVEITDFECPYCSRVQSELARVLAGHPEVRLVVVNAPMPFHRHAAVAAEAALEAFAQGGDAAFFRMHDLLFDNQHALAPADLRTYAERAGLDVARFSAALESGTHRPALARDVALASSLGVRGTPTFYINGRPVLGAQPYEVFEEVVVEELEAAEGLIEQGLPRERVYDAFRAAARSRARSIGELGFDDFADEGPDDDDEEPELEPETYELAVPTDRPSRGAADAPVVVQIVTDFECPFCSRVLPTLEALRERYGDRVRFVLRYYPLPFHSHAALAAEAAHEVFVQRGSEAFFRYHDVLFANQTALEREDLERYAAELRGISMPRFRRALDRRTHRSLVQEEIATVTAAGGRIGTPSFFINGYLVKGAQPLEVFVATIDQALRAAGVPPVREP